MSFVFIQQISKLNRTTPHLLQPRSLSGLAAITSSGLTSSLTVLQQLQRKHLHRTGLSQQARFPSLNRALLLPSTFKSLLQKTWTQQTLQVLLKVTNSASQRRSLPFRRRLSLHLNNLSNQKQRRRKRSQGRKTPRVLSHCRSQLRRVKVLQRSWSVCSALK